MKLRKKQLPGTDSILEHLVEYGTLSVGSQLFPDADSLYKKGWVEIIEYENQAGVHKLLRLTSRGIKKAHKRLYGRKIKINRHSP